MRARFLVAVLMVAGALAASSTAPAAPTARCKGRVANIVGTKGADQIGGTQHRDVIVARGGDDFIFARGGNDLICAGGGDDTVDGKNGNDRIFGQKGNDFLRGGNGDDIVSSGGGAVHFLMGGSGDDRIVGNKRFAVAFFHDSPNGVRVDLRTDTARGFGRDSLKDIDFVVGSPFDDVLKGDSGGNILYGNDGNDRLESGGNSGSLRALQTLGVLTRRVEYDLLDGDGIIELGRAREPGNDTLIGGRGLNIANYLSSDTPVQVDLRDGTAIGQGNDSLSRIQLVGGSVFADVLKGDGGENAFEAEAGADEIDGRGGEDTVLYIDASTVDADLADGEATATNAVAIPGAEQSTDDIMRIEDVMGSLGPDTLAGDGSENDIFGFEGDDFLEGRAGDDILLGGGGRDTVDGGSGDDVCDGEDAVNCEAPPRSRAQSFAAQKAELRAQIDAFARQLGVGGLSFLTLTL